MKSRVLHELIHFNDDCKDRLNTCDDAACSEVRAYEGQEFCNHVKDAKSDVTASDGQTDALSFLNSAVMVKILTRLSIRR